MKKFLVVALVAGALAACEDKRIATQESTQTVHYGRSLVGFLVDGDMPPGCQMWHVWPWSISKETGLKVIPHGSNVTKVTVCKTEGQPARTTWEEQSGKHSYTRESFSVSGTSFLDAPEGGR